MKGLNFTSRVIISNITNNLLDAILGQLIEVSLDMNYIKLECEGLADYMISTDLLNCSDPTQIGFCDRRDKIV